MDGLARAGGHVDRATPWKLYCTELLLAGERKSVEPVAARLAPDKVRRIHQPLHHVIADAPWSDEEMLAEVRSCALPALRQKEAVAAWIVDDTGFPKKRRQSVGVTRQYCGQGRQAGELPSSGEPVVSTNSASLPIAWRLYLPQEWADGKARRRQAGVPEEIQFETKPAIALQQIRAAVEQNIPAPVLAHAGYGTDTRFREAISELGLSYVVGLMSWVSVWKPAEALLAKREWTGTGRRTKLLQPDADHQPVTLKGLARGLPDSAWKTLIWRQGTKYSLRSHFAAMRVRPAHRYYWRSQPHPEECLLIEWPHGEAEPTEYWLPTLPAATRLSDLVRLGKQRWTSSGIIKSSSKNSVWGTLRGEAGVVFIIMRLSALPLTAS
jgi:SRSO17 transposase